jgi:hypothetical protein
LEARMRRTAARRWLAATGIATALLLPFAVSAAAAPAPTFAIILPDTLVAAGSGVTQTDPVVVPSEPVVLHNLTFRYDLSEVSAFVDVTFDEFQCTHTSHVITCVYDDQSLGGGSSFIGLTIAAKATAEEGDEGSVTITATADGFAAVTDTGKVSVGQGVNLAAEIAPNVTAAVGGGYDEKLGVQNVGTVTGHGVVLQFFGDYAIEAGALRYSNCTYEGNQYRTCMFDTEMAPDKSYGAALPFRLRGDTAAPDKEFIEFGWLTPAEWDAEKAFLTKLGLPGAIGQPGNGPALTLTEKGKEPVETPDFMKTRQGVKQTDTVPADNFTESTITVTGHQSGDVAAFGDQAGGAAGAEVGVTLGVVNLGPAAIDHGRSAEDIVDVLFTVPPGTTVTQAPEQCFPFLGADPDFEHPGRAGAKKYICGSGFFMKPADKVAFAFKLRINTVIANAKGEVKVTDFFSGQPLRPIIDSNPANDIAQVVLNGTSPASPSANPSPSEGAGLPVTGTPTLMITFLGALTVAFGFVLYRLARRRRVTGV